MTKLTEVRGFIAEAADDIIRRRLHGAACALKLIGNIDGPDDDRDEIAAAMRYLGKAIENDTRSCTSSTRPGASSTISRPVARSL